MKVIKIVGLSEIPFWYPDNVSEGNLHGFRKARREGSSLSPFIRHSKPQHFFISLSKPFLDLSQRFRAHNGKITI